MWTYSIMDLVYRGAELALGPGDPGEYSSQVPDPAPSSPSSTTRFEGLRQPRFSVPRNGEMRGALCRRP
jgi:hypothetical protein